MTFAPHINGQHYSPAHDKRLQKTAAEHKPAHGGYPGKVLECANPDCGWKGQSNRMCGSIGPLCPVCDEIAE